MWLNLLFRTSLLAGFLLVAWKWGDWRRWQKYYSSMLFVALVDMSAGYISYHHSLWIFDPDALIKTETIVELINSYLLLPATTLVYLANFPSEGRGRQGAYILLWVFIYSTLEYVDHAIIGGISYSNGWSFRNSIFFDFLCLQQYEFTIPDLYWDG